MKQFALIFLLPVLLFPQNIPADENLNNAFLNAKKGYFWALSHIPEKKTQIQDDLIDKDKLICSVNLEKGINGVKIQSTGFFETCEVKITAYKSTDNLVSEGYLKSKKEDNTQTDADSVRKKKK